MCFTAEYSRDAYFINTAGSLLLLYTTSNPEVRAVALFLLFTGIMQLFDYVFWTYPPPSNVNTFATKLAMVFNHLQPVVLLLAVHSQKLRVGDASKILVLLYSVVAVVYSIRAWPKLTGTQKSLRGQGLVWEWTLMPGARTMYVMFLAAFATGFMENFSGYRRYLYTSLAAGLYAFSHLKYTVESRARMWCYLANMVPVVIFAIEALER